MRKYEVWIQIMRVEVEDRVVVVAETGDSGEEEVVFASMELDTVVVLHRSQLACKVNIVVCGGVEDGSMGCVEDVVLMV